MSIQGLNTEIFSRLLWGSVVVVVSNECLTKEWLKRCRRRWRLPHRHTLMLWGESLEVGTTGTDGKSLEVGTTGTAEESLEVGTTGTAGESLEVGTTGTAEESLEVGTTSTAGELLEVGTTGAAVNYMRIFFSSDFLTWIFIILDIPQLFDTGWSKNAKTYLNQQLHSIS